jgi:hypothetical protein
MFGITAKEIFDPKEETLARFIERTLLGWSKYYRRYHINGRSYGCYESDEQWEKHLVKIDKLVDEALKRR